MPTTYTSAELIAAVLRRARLPNTAAEGSADADILAFLNEVMDLTIVPFMVNLREDYYVLTEEQTITSGINRYRIPKRAIANKFREIKYRSTAGDPATEVDLPVISREHLSRYTGGSDTGGPLGFYYENVDLVLVPENLTSTGSVKWSYFFRPSDLVHSDYYRQITAVNTQSGVLTFATARPATWLLTSKYDIHSSDSGAEVNAWDITPTAVGQTQLTFSAAAINGTATGRKVVEVGDYICLAGECAVPAVPKELHPLLVLETALHMITTQGAIGQADKIEKMLERIYPNIIRMYEDRVEGETESVDNPDSIWFGGGANFIAV